MEMEMFLLNKLLGQMTAAEALARSTGPGLTLIDVRETSELRISGKAKGALHLPLARLQQLADPKHPDFCGSLSRDHTLAVYCASGGRSMAARKILRGLGYKDVHNIGGLGHWQQAGGQVEPA
jgi:rhodanese-related sulfurtransferase